MIIAEILSWAARQWPDKEALVDIDPTAGNARRSLTFRELDNRSNKLANALIASGIHKGDRVLHFMKNRIEWIEAYFGIIKAGALVTPLNFRFTSQDVTYATKITQPAAFILENELAETVKPIISASKSIKHYISIGVSPPLGMTDYDSFIAPQADTPPQTEILETDDLGIYFTSGTTGEPKPILFTQKNIFTVALSNGLTIPLPRNSNSVIYCPLYHTATFFFWLPNLFQGGKGTILRGFSLRSLLETIEREKGTEVNIPLPHCVDLITAQEKGEVNINNYNLTSWQLVNTGAQPYPASVLHDMVALLPAVGIQHGYGISEGGGATLTRLPPWEILQKPGSCGRPSAMVDIRIVDENGKNVPSGSPGELVLKSDRMMKGYYRNEKATAEAIKDGWLYTGDIARRDDEGYIHIVDRKKDVIISGGENVYPVEVESLLMTHPKIMEVAVIGLPDIKWGECVTAVIKLKPGDIATKEELLIWCQNSFPAYKRPRRIEFGDLPKSATNKVLKTELRLKYGGKRSAV